MAKHPKLASPESNRVRMYHGVEASTQSWVAGNLVYATSGKVTECASDAVMVLGIAKAAASGTASTAAVVELLFPGDVVEFDCYDTSDASLKASSNFVEGKAYDLVVASSVHMIDFDETSSKEFAIFEGPVATLDDSTSYRGRFRITSAVCQSVVGND